MNLLEIQEKLGVQIPELHRHAIEAGFGKSEQSLRDIFSGRVKNPSVETWLTIEKAFIKAAEQRESSLVKEIVAWFDKYRDGDDDDDA